VNRIEHWRPRLEVRDLELIVALAAARSTVAAAKTLHLTQSAVSRALTQAEDRLNVKLFERSARGLALTPVGERLLTGASAVLQQLRELERSALSPEALPVHVRLVSECYTAYRWLPAAMLDLRQRLPDLRVEVATSSRRHPVRALLRDEVDIALLTTAEVPKGKGLGESALFSDEVVFIVSARHPLSKAQRLTRAELARHPLITGETPQAEARWFQARVFGRRPPKLQYLHFPLTEAIIDSARAGLGIAVLSEWMASGYLGAGDLKVLRLATGPLERPWRIAYRRGAQVTAERLKSALQAAAPRLPAVPA
jgi:LysR family transcriptional regulator, regulator for metE and metH